MSEEQCMSNSITPIRNVNILARDIIIGDGNCFFRAISKELFGEGKHHKCLHTILVEYIELNGRNFKQYLSNGSGSIMDRNTVAECKNWEWLSLK